MRFNRIDILKNTNVGIEFEFFTELKDKQIQSSLEKHLNVNVVIPLSADSFNEQKPMVHSPVVPTSSVFKLEIDNSGGPKMKELITGPLPYYIFKKQLIKMLSWIKENGWTSEKCGIHLNISFNEHELELRRGLEHLNKLKFILNFDENFIYDRFPNRKNNVYARSIKDIKINGFTYNISKFSSLKSQQFKLPKLKYFGINFLKTVDDYIEIRYLGGPDYEDKFTEILEVFEYTAISLFDVMKNPQMEHADFEELRKTTIRYNKFHKVYKNPLLLPMVLPNLSVTVDLSADIEVIKTHWMNIKSKLFFLVINCNVNKGHFNYNSDTGVFEISNAKIKSADLNGYTIISSDVNAIIDNCNLETCRIESSIIHNSSFFNDNETKNSKIEDCVVSQHNNFTKCYIDNHDFMFNGNLINSIFRSGVKGTFMQYDKKTIIID